MEDFSIIPVEDLAGFKQQSHRRTAYYIPPTSVEVQPLELLSRRELVSAITPVMRQETKRKAGIRAPLMDDRSVVFIDGEGSNIGDPVILEKNGLRKSLQQQNYSLLTAVFEDESVKRIIGKDNVGRLSTVDCLEFLLSLPEDQLLISFGFTYDVEMILRDLSVTRGKDGESPMQRLHHKHRVYWGSYSIIYIPHKLFYIRRREKKKNKGKEKPDSRKIFDIAGFFGNVGFKTVTEKWKVATPEEQEFINRMKKARPDFGPITQEVLDYNELEGKLGIRVFNKIRSEWIGLGLRVSSPHGAGSLASAMYVQNQLENYMTLEQSVEPSPFKRGYIGGRFDYTQQGEFDSVYESDINSAYPHIMRNLPCLSHTEIRYVNGIHFDPSNVSLWLVRWRDTGQRWALFPYRSGKHIRYHSSGIGWYWNAEVGAALQLDPTLEILEGYQFIPKCDEKPFGWIETFYNRRQELKATQPFTAEVLKIGMNSGYGKLAQTKGYVPRYQCLMWAGMITSGTHAMLLNAIAQAPDKVICVSTDSVTSTIPLDLDYDEIRLGAWKQKKMNNYLLLGNGFAYSPDGKDTHRGFLDDEWNWERAKSEWEQTGHITAWKMRFNTAYDAWTQKDLSLRCTWSKFQSELGFELPKGREIDSDGWIWPSINPTPTVLSDELSIAKENLRVSQFGFGDFLLDLEEKEKLSLEDSLISV
jgi:hypothetical protein